jgi:hypothetical protein
METGLENSLLAWILARKAAILSIPENAFLTLLSRKITEPIP